MTTPKEVLAALLKQKFLLISITAIFAAGSMIGFRFVPKRFKVSSAVGIQTQYFQNPLVRDFLPETFDGAELRAQREGIIRRALNHEFLMKLGKKYNLFDDRKDTEITSYELDLLGKRFEIMPTGATSFLIGFFSGNAEQGYRIMLEVISHIRSTLTTERRATLTRLHDAIRDRLESLSFGREGGVTSVMASRPDLVKAEIERTEEEARVLRQNLSDKHPKVTALVRKIEQLKKVLKTNEETPATQTRSNTFSSANVDAGSKDLFTDLLKKYHYLEVVMYLDEQNQGSYLTVLQEPFIPKAAVWPKRPIFLIWGVAAGFLVGTLFVLATELTRGWRERSKGREETATAGVPWP